VFCRFHVRKITLMIIIIMRFNDGNSARKCMLYVVICDVKLSIAYF
jgi:hypothetical protein